MSLRQAEPAAKALGLVENDALRIKQSDQMKNPDSRFRISEHEDLPLLLDYAEFIWEGNSQRAI